MSAGPDAASPDRFSWPDARASPSDAGVEDAEPTPVDAAAPDAEVGEDAELAEDADVNPPAFDPSALPEAPLEHFPLGVASGDVLPTEALLWTRYEGSGLLLLYVWPEAEPASARSTSVLLESGFAHTVVSGLAPGIWHRYAFVEVSAEPEFRSPLGRFRTALADDALEPLIIGGSACTSNIRDFPTLEAAGARTDLDLFVLLGDTSYNDDAETTDEYRARWASNLEKVGYRALRASTSVVATWDDHEVGNNWDPETISPTLLETARAAFFEHLPIRRASEDPRRIWRRLRWGHTLEIFVLDGRSERRPSTRETANPIYLSPEQLDWLQQGLASSPAVFKMIMNSVPIGAFPASFNLGPLLSPGDRWQAYAAQREALLSFIENNVPGVFFLSGDFHLACSGRAARSGPGSQTLEILVGPGAQFPNPLYRLLGGPQFDFSTDEMNFGVLHLDPIARQVRIVYHRDDGQAFAEQTYVL